MTTNEFLLRAWEPRPPAVAACVLLLLAYCFGTGSRFRARAAAWFGGDLLILLSLISPLDTLARDYLFAVHMAQHIVLLLGAPALLLIGLPGEALQHLLRRPALARAERFLRRPAVAWPVGIGAMAFWHVPAVFNAAAASGMAAHAAEHVSLLAAGMVYWWPILSPLAASRLNPVPQAAAYLITSCLACTAMGVLLTFAPRLLYPAYVNPADPYGILPLIRRGWGISPALDQQIGGLLMWVPGCLIYLSAIMAMFGRWYAQPAEAAAEA